MTVTLYVDLLSQPGRALTLFVKKTNIPHKLVKISIAKGENKKPDYIKNIHKFGRVPAIDDEGFIMIESIAIFRYLARKYDVPDHWYPKDIKLRARVDEFLEWQHLGLRANITLFFIFALRRPVQTGKRTDPKILKMYTSKMEESLDDLENVWLKDSLYLVGDTISIADLVGICEIEHPRMAKYDVTKGRPKIKNWMKRVQDQLQPYYEEIFADLNEIANKDHLKL